MQLRYNNRVANRVIYMDLETANFSRKEDDALKKFGEPVIKFEKVYNGGHSISIERRIKTGFKIRVKFDGSEDMAMAVEAANNFFEDLTDELTLSMQALMEKLENPDYIPEIVGSGFRDINYF